MGYILMFFIYMYLLKHESLWKHWHKNIGILEATNVIQSCHLSWLVRVVFSCVPSSEELWLLHVSLQCYLCRNLIYISIHIWLIWMMCVQWTNLNPPNHFIVSPRFQVFLLAWNTWDLIILVSSRHLEVSPYLADKKKQVLRIKRPLEMWFFWLGKGLRPTKST